jgi:hypothetical protein
MKHVSKVDISPEVAQRSTIINIFVTFITYVINNLYSIKSFEIKFFNDYLFSSFLTYILDILFVQKYFTIKHTLKEVKYGNFNKRIFSLLNHQILYKFAVVMSIASIINKSVFVYVKDKLDKQNVFISDDKLYYRDLIIQLMINAFTTIIIINVLKFKWAYINSQDINLNILILFWFSLSILVTVSNY